MLKHVFQFSFRCFSSPPLHCSNIAFGQCNVATYIHNICKTHLRSRIAYLSIVRTHAQKEGVLHLDLTGSPILKILVHLTLRKKVNAFTQFGRKWVPSLKMETEILRGGGYKIQVLMTFVNVSCFKGRYLNFSFLQ